MRSLRRHLVALAAAAPALFAAASAQSSDQNAAADTAIACLDLASAEERLACLEGAAKALKATRIRPETAEESAAAEAAAPVIAAGDMSEEQAFGAEALASTKKAVREKDRTTRLNAKVVEFRVNQLGDITAVLENGQVWRQLSGDSTIIRLPKKDEVLTVTIKRGPLGNYMMQVNELKRSIRVRRIK
ncbi:MAG: hypothetical protein U5J99_12325 [Parvularculaceae bacterium]|nr:hypothetical protein [Parvularculaceae bacterium]